MSVISLSISSLSEASTITVSFSVSSGSVSTTSKDVVSVVSSVSVGGALVSVVSDVSEMTISVVLFIPYEYYFVSDGGSHGCRAIAYSVWYQHSLNGPDARDESNGMMYRSYTAGWTVEVFGIEVYSESHEEKEYTISISEHDATVDAIKQSVNAS